mgnify:CR=1 FL=1
MPPQRRLSKRPIERGRARNRSPIARSGRAQEALVGVQRIEQQRAAGRQAFDDAEDAGETLLGLLLTDRQVRRLLGVLPAPDAAWSAARAERAVDRFLRLFAPA